MRLDNIYILTPSVLLKQTNGGLFSVYLQRIHSRLHSLRSAVIVLYRVGLANCGR